MRVQGVLLILTAILALLWVVALQDDDHPEWEPPSLDAGDREEAESALEVDRPDLAPAPAGARDGERRRDAARAPRQVRVPDPEPTPTIGVRGVVRDRGGVPIEGAIVYQLGKRAPAGSDRLKTSSTMSDRNGAFSLRARPLKGTWIGAKAHGFINAFVDGEGLAPGVEVALTMDDALVLRVVLVDTNGEPVADEGVRVMPMTRRGVPRAFPGPESLEQERFDATNADGVATFLFNQDCPVVVLPTLEGGLVTPRDRWLPSPSGSVEFVTEAGVTLSIKRVDAETGKEVFGPTWVTVRDERGQEVDRLVRDETEGGRLQMELPIPTGRYAIELYERDREPSAASFLVSNPGDSVEVVIHTKSLSEAAVLELRLPPPAAETETKRLRSTQPLVFVRRMGDGFDQLGWQRIELMKWKPAERRGEVQLRPGDYDVVVLDRAFGACGTLPRTRLEPGERATARVRLGGGTVLKLTEILPADLRVRALAVEVEGLGWFAPAGWNGLLGGTLRGEDDVLNVLDRFQGKGVTLGPYPGRVTLHVTDWEGREHRFLAR